MDTTVYKSFMKNTIEQYNQIRIQAKLEMSRELDKMPIGKFQLVKPKDDRKWLKFHKNLIVFSVWVNTFLDHQLD